MSSIMIKSLIKPVLLTDSIKSNALKTLTFSFKKPLLLVRIGIVCLTTMNFAHANNAASTLPDLGSTAGNILPPHVANKVGAAFVRQARSRAKFVNDPLLLDYLNTLGNKLVKVAVPGTAFENQKFQFHLIEDSSPNAFAVPGGQIFFHTGLIVDSKSEAELAGVLAHEIAHITENHSARGIENSKYDNVIAIASILLAAASGSAEAAQAAVALSQGGLIQKRLNFTRGFEREADNIAIVTLNKAGYNPSALADFLHTFNRRQNFAGSRPPAFLLTHPLTDERITETESRARAYPEHKQPNENKQTFNDFKAAILANHHRSPQKLANFYRLNRSALQNSSERFKYGIALTKLKKFDEAETQLQLALRDSPNNLHYLIAQSELDIARKNHSAAVKLFERIKQELPEEYNKIELYHAYTLITAKTNKLAIPILKNAIRRSPKDPDARILIARAYGELGLLYDSYKARAEHHYLLGNYAFAIKQLDNAAPLAPNEYEKNNIQTTKAEYLKEKRQTEKALKRL